MEPRKTFEGASEMSGEEKPNRPAGRPAGGIVSPEHAGHDVKPTGGEEQCGMDQWANIAQWRATERKRLIDERLALSSQDRQASAERIAARLDRIISRISGRIVSSYWPVRGEPDLRNWSIRVIERGGRIALPVAIRKGWPLEFRLWSPGDPLERSIGDILVPSRGPPVRPDIVIAPVVGFDASNYRLGYGGGFFDRTLAAMRQSVFAIGVGYGTSRIETIRPQPHDVALDAIVTDE